MPKHSRSKPKYGKIFVTIIERECKKELIRNENSTAEEITELLLLNFRNQFRHRPSLLRNVDQTLQNIRQNISGGNDRLIKLQDEYVKNVESSTGSGLDFDNTTSDESDHSYSDSVFDVTKDMLRESYLNNSGIKKSSTVFAEERDDDAGYDKNEAKTEKGIEFNRKSKNDSTKKTFKRNYSTVETREDAVFNQKKAKMARFEEHVELEEVVNSVKNQKKKDLLWRNKKDISEEVRKGNPGGPMFKDLGGISEILKKIKSEIIFPLFNAELSRDLGITPIKGILLKGSPGCGKTTLVRAIANETGIPFYYIAATELVSGISGASEDNIRELFAKAYRTAPSIIFIDEIDAIGSKRDNQRREMETRIVAQLLACMDESNKAVESSNSDPNTSRKSDCVLVFGATNRPDALDAALRRAGRFEREITLNFPDEKARFEILSVLAKKLRVKGSLDLAKIARSTHAFVGADLKALINNAGRHAVERMRDSDWGENWWMRTLSTKEREPIHITMADLEEAVKLVQPSSTREGFSSIPNVKWEDVGGLPELRKEFNLFIIKPLKNPDNYVNVDLDFGFLLYGPPGCGKTLIAMAVANEAGANFIHIKAGELLNKYVGESERAVRTLFSRARTCSPCIIFFDEVDALTSNGDTEGGGVVDRLLRQLMIELSGSDDRRNVFIIGATNRPEVMDPALFRDGRFGKLIHVTLPNAEERGSILTALARKKNIDASVDLIAFGRDEACKNLSGSDLKALLNNAAMLAINEGDAVIASEEACKDLGGADTSKLLKKDVIVAVERQAAGSSISGGPSWPIKKKHLVLALKKICPTVSEERKQYYYLFEQSLKAACRDIRDGEKENFVDQKSDPQNVDPKVVLNDNDLPIIDNDTRPRRQQRNAPPLEPRRRASSSANMINGIERTVEICEKMVNRSTSLEPQVTIKECMKILKEMEDEVPQTSPLYLFAIRLFYKQEHRDVFKELEPSMRVPWIANELTEAKKK